MKILLLDIETSPNTAYVWGLFKENIPIQRLIESSYVMCWSAKWHDSDEVMFGSFLQGHKRMLKRVHKLLDDADCVVHYYGSRFDIPTLNKEFILHGMAPPSPYKEVDLYKVVKSKFKFASNKLDYVAQKLGLGAKHNTNFTLWVDCMARKEDAWRKMESYNRQDVILLEKLYQVILPWVKGHASFAVFDGQPSCPNCGGAHSVRRGFHYTATLKYQRYRCNDCGTWSRGGVAIRQQGERRVNI